MENLEIIAKETLDGGKYITSIEIAELTGKMHKHVMEAIRKMESAWEEARFLSRLELFGTFYRYAPLGSYPSAGQLLGGRV